MKEFVKTMLAVICALIVLSIIRFVFFLVMLGSMAAMGGTTPAIPKSGAVLDINLEDFTLSEQTNDQPAPQFSLAGVSATMSSVGVRDALLALQEAASDPAIRFVLLRPDAASGGVAQLEEFRQALESFRSFGKPILAYTENPSNGSYYLASVADKILMGSAHGGTYMLTGLATQQFFLKDILDKLGVNVQLIRHGKYKSAGEMFIRSTSSPENREQTQVMVNSLWASMSGTMAEARGLSVEELNSLIDDLAFVLPEDFVKHGLVDELVDHETLQDKVCTLAQVEDIKKVHLVPFADYIEAKVSENFSRDKVAVIYAEGEIVEGDETSEVAGDRFVRIIEKVKNDDKVKAVVLRVNSPGGSVSASVKIRTALDKLMAVKPLVASYGDYAASGGYWISSGCHKIYADATCLTGSIGVFSMIPEFSKVAKNIGVGVETIGSNKHSDMMTLMRPFDPKETAYMQASVEDIYELFVNLVANSRGMEPEKVDEIAQGRVWAATDALQIGLVDEIGSLQDAIAYAAALADLNSSDDYSVQGYPTPPTFVEQLLEQFGTNKQDNEISAFLSYQPGKFYARMPYNYVIR